MTEQVKIRQVNFADLVKRREGDDYNRPDPSYQFSNNREFQSTDKTESGIYRRD
jgi:hypothetical protein